MSGEPRSSERTARLEGEKLQPPDVVGGGFPVSSTYTQYEY